MRGKLSVLALLVLGCGSSDPYCSEFVDATGRAAAYCPNPRDEPVCDLPGERAHFEETPMGILLMGGRRATCDGEFEIVCPLDTVGEAYCIESLDPP
jgi:hypothetical protein